MPEDKRPALREQSSCWKATGQPSPPSVLKQKDADSSRHAWSRAAGTALPRSNNAGPGALGLPLDTGRAAEQLHFISGRDLTALGPSAVPSRAGAGTGHGRAVPHHSYAVLRCGHGVTHMVTHGSRAVTHVVPHGCHAVTHAVPRSGTAVLCHHVAAVPPRPPQPRCPHDPVYAT